MLSSDTKQSPRPKANTGTCWNQYISLISHKPDHGLIMFGIAIYFIIFIPLRILSSVVRLLLFQFWGEIGVSCGEESDYLT